MFTPRASTLRALRFTGRPRALGVSVNSIVSSVHTQTANASTVSQTITDDHRELEKLYSEIVGSRDVDHQERFGNQFVWELARHSVAEELIVYPAMEKYMGAQGKQHAEKDRKQHHKVKEMLKVFQNMRPEDPKYVPQLKELWSDLKLHIQEEEKSDLPALEKALASAENQGSSESLAKNFDRTKMFVPSRSHPSAGENPYFEGPMGMLAAPIDHIADLFRKFPDGTISPNPSKK
jgi:hemerythrin-like domain-containing protein